MNRDNLSRIVLFIIFLFVPVTVCHAQFGSPAPAPENLKPGFESITPEKCKTILNVLAGPTFEGRGTGQVGYTRAAHWVAGKLAEFGLQPVGDSDTFFQMMPITRRIPVMKECKLTGPGGLEIDGDGNLGFERFTETAELTSEVVFVHFTGKEPQFDEGVNLRDKIVIYTTDEAAASRAPRLIARQRPAAAIRIIDTTPKSVDQIVFEGRRSRSTSVSGTISKSAADQVAQACNVTLGEPGDGGIAMVSTGQEVSIRMRIREEKSSTPNVIGLIEGSDPKLKHEYVVIGAHLDHLGTRSGQVYFGADDNGSGSTAILTIAHAIATNPVKPKRSILFLWFAAEEVGLVGSRYYTEHPLLPLENMTCMLNIDMVGRNEETQNETAVENEGHIHLVGSKKGESSIHDLILAANKHIGFEFEFDEEDVFGRSDQINFYRKNVPVAFLFGGFHPDYHQPSDQTSKINYAKIASAARLFYLVAYAAADHGRFELKEASPDDK